MHADVEGHIWSAIRGELPYQIDRFKSAANADSHAQESIFLDGMARDLAKAVAKKLDATTGGLLE